MFEERDNSLKIEKKLPQKLLMNHSTPLEVSTLSKNMVSLLNPSAHLSPVPNKSSQPMQSFEDWNPLPKVQSSWDLLQQRLSIEINLNEEISNSSPFTFPRRRLSTIISSEEPSVALHQTFIPPMTSKKRTDDLVQLNIQSNEVTPEQMPNWQETATFKEPIGRRKRNRNIVRKLVEKRKREWELRQLQNIEEATTYELIIEDI